VICYEVHARISTCANPAIAVEVKQKFAAKEKVKTAKKAGPKPPANQQAKTVKKPVVA